MQSRHIRIVVSYLLAAICLFWVFHDIEPRRLAAGMAHICWWLWLLCVGAQFLAYFCVAYEWQLLLRPIGTLPLKPATQAVFAGRFANDVLPFQLGYLVRCLLAARWMNVNLISIFPSLIVERLWDGLWLAFGIGLAAVFSPLPSDVARAAKVFGTLVIAGAAAMILVLLRRSRGGTPAGGAMPLKSGTNLFQRIHLAFGRLTEGVRQIVRSGILLPVLGLSLLKLAIQAVAFLGFLRAYHLTLPLPDAMVIFLAGYLGICVPSTPAGTGMFQLFVVAALAVFGINKSLAAGFALAAFVSITVPLATAGFFALAQSGLSLGEVRKNL
ncbi:MAG: lysylphosphatidylglycerol synthase transmembrane domain-containing protein [Limisphaerales bacterium]